MIGKKIMRKSTTFLILGILLVGGLMIDTIDKSKPVQQTFSQYSHELIMTPHTVSTPYGVQSQIIPTQTLCYDNGVEDRL